MVRVGDKSTHEARYWNTNGTQIAIVAVVTEGIDWAAYIGGMQSNQGTEANTCRWTADYGAKLSEKDARHFFPEMTLPYRE